MADHSDLPAPVPGATITRTVKNELRYLVEEERLAGDIYALAKSLYGDRVFANIARAEHSHADQVRLLLERYDVADPTKGRANGLVPGPRPAEALQQARHAGQEESG